MSLSTFYTTAELLRGFGLDIGEVGDVGNGLVDRVIQFSGGRPNPATRKRVPAFPTLARRAKGRGSDGAYVVRSNWGGIQAQGEN